MISVCLMFDCAVALQPLWCSPDTFPPSPTLFKCNKKRVSKDELVCFSLYIFVSFLYCETETKKNGWLKTDKLLWLHGENLRWQISFLKMTIINWLNGFLAPGTAVVIRAERVSMLMQKYFPNYARCVNLGKATFFSCLEGKYYISGFYCLLQLFINLTIKTLTFALMRYK